MVCTIENVSRGGLVNLGDTTSHSTDQLTDFKPNLVLLGGLVVVERAHLHPRLTVVHQRPLLHSVTSILHSVTSILHSLTSCLK